MNQTVFGVQRQGVKAGVWLSWSDAGGDGDDCGPVVAVFGTREAAETRAAELESEFRRDFDPMVSGKIGNDEANRQAPELATEFGLPAPAEDDYGSAWWERTAPHFTPEQRLRLWERFAPKYRHYRILELPLRG